MDLNWRATWPDKANDGLENNGKIRHLHPNIKILGKHQFNV
ncbi:hypothetical protein TRICHSKD4_2438 [Roseibium sp. TrichSKD4]|nr:hypothetical protein TRICHSKD4_2438 [Roseibium sp. TrichSKD4]